MATETKNTKTFYNTEIPIDWTIIQLGALGTFSKGKGILKEQVISEGLPCIRYGEIYTTHDFIIKEFKSFISGDVAAESKEIKSGDILFAGSGETVEEIGKAVAYIGTAKAYAGGDVIILSTKSDVNPECLSYVLESDFVKRQKRVLGQGNSVVHIYSSDLSKLKIPLPPLPEQKAIAKVLSTADAAIHTTEKLIAQKELRKKWLMQQLLKGEVRLKNFDNQEWNQYTLGDLYQHKRGQLLSKEKLSPLGKFKCVLYGELFTTYAEVIDEVVNRTDFEEGTPSKFGDLLMPGSTTTTGIDLTVTTAILEDDVLLGGDINIFRMKNNLTDPVFMSYFLTHTQKRQLLRMPQGITIIHLYGSDLLGIKFKIPSIEEQKAIAQVLQAADTEIKLLKTKTDKLREKKKGLMQVLLTGKVRLKINDI